jgi:BMFP domain-containing protein YqiC
MNTPSPQNVRRAGNEVERLKAVARRRLAKLEWSVEHEPPEVQQVRRAAAARTRNQLAAATARLARLS